MVRAWVVLLAVVGCNHDYTELTGGLDSGTSADGATDTGPIADASDSRIVDRPVVELIDPEPGSVNVIEQAVTIRFSEPMDTGSVEAAISSATEFTWSDGDRTSRFQVPFPFAETPQPFDIVVPRTVRDAEGDEMGSDAVFPITLASFRLEVLEFQNDLTGNVKEGSSSYFTFLFAGDDAAGLLQFAAISFPLGSLPAHESTLGTYRVTFSSQLTRTTGDPADARLSGWVMDRVEYDSGAEIAMPVVHEAAFAELFTDGLVLGDPIAVDVTDQLETAWVGAASHLQLRFHPRQASLNDTADRVYIRRNADENDATVDESVMDPDPANRARLVVRYFVP